MHTSSACSFWEDWFVALVRPHLTHDSCERSTAHGLIGATDWLVTLRARYGSERVEQVTQQDYIKANEVLGCRWKLDHPCPSDACAWLPDFDEVTLSHLTNRTAYHSDLGFHYDTVWSCSGACCAIPDSSDSPSTVS